MAGRVASGNSASTYYILDGCYIARQDSDKQIYCRNYETGNWTLSNDSEMNQEILLKGRVITLKYADERFQAVWKEEILNKQEEILKRAAAVSGKSSTPAPVERKA